MLDYKIMQIDSHINLLMDEFKEIETDINNNKKRCFTLKARLNKNINLIDSLTEEILNKSLNNIHNLYLFLEKDSQEILNHQKEIFKYCEVAKKQNQNNKKEMENFEWRIQHMEVEIIARKTKEPGYRFLKVKKPFNINEYFNV